MKLVLLAAAVSAASPTPAPQDQQFDLICTSKYHDATFHYRVDLGTRQYCVTQDAGKRLTSIGDDCFMDTVEAYSNALSFGIDPVQNVDRVTGEWYFRPFEDRYTMYRGTCEKAPFSGFTTVRTKF